MSDVNNPVPYAYEWPKGHPVVTIDIGTSRSACSITFVGSEITAQELVTPAGSAYRNSHLKVETALLLRPVDLSLNPVTTPTFTSANDVEFVAFGDQAETVFGDMDESERCNYIFCKHFKLLLLEEEEPIISSNVGGFAVSLQVVFTKVLEIYRHTAINHLRKTIRSDLEPVDVLWVLTIPAIWTERNKRKMRTAAFDAGLIADVDDRSLLLCLEPEGVCFAALQQSMQLPIGRDAMQSVSAINTTYDLCDDEEDFLDVDEVLKSEVRDQECDIGQALSSGSKIVTFDLGGGTIDLAALEITAAHGVKLFKVKQLAAPTGGEFGGTQVDKQFMIMIHEIIGEEPSKVMTDRYRHVELEIRRAWETVKVSAKRDPSEAVPGVIQLASLQQEVLAPLGLKLTDLIANYRAKQMAAGISTQLCPEARGDTCMVLSTDLIAEFFRPSIDSAIDCLHKYLTTTRAREATHLLMAGGYSACPFLWDAVLGCISRLRDDNGERTILSVHKVNNPDTAIVRGAAIYGTAHRVKVESRIAKCTYGEAVLVRFNPLNPEHQKRSESVEVDHRGLRYLPVFEKHVTVGQSVPVGYTSARHQCVPVHDECNSITKIFLSSTAENPCFPDEEGVDQVASFTCPVDVSVPFEERVFETQYEFGGTEVKLNVYRLYDNHKESITTTYF